MKCTKMVLPLYLKSFVNLCRNPVSQDISARATQGDSHVVRFNVESKNQNPSFKDLARVGELEEAEASGVQPGSETSTHWMGPGTSPNLTSAHDDPNSYPYLPTVLEEPGSSFSEGLDHMGSFSYKISFLLHLLPSLRICPSTVKFIVYILRNSPYLPLYC